MKVKIETRWQPRLAWHSWWATTRRGNRKSLNNCTKTSATLNSRFFYQLISNYVVEQSWLKAWPRWFFLTWWKGFSYFSFVLSIVPFQQDLFFRVLILTELRKISKAVPKGLASHTAISKTLRYWEQRFNLQLLENGWSYHCRDIWPHPF